MLVWVFRDLANGTEPDSVSALEVTVHADHVAAGLSRRMMDAMRDAAAAAGFTELVAPVRPNEKHKHPRLAMADYVALTREDGLGGCAPTSVPGRSSTQSHRRRW